MAITVKERINAVTLICGITILVLGILMFPTEFVIEKLIGDDYRMNWANQSQYWGVLPVGIFYHEHACANFEHLVFWYTHENLTSCCRVVA